MNFKSKKFLSVTLAALIAAQPVTNCNVFASPSPWFAFSSSPFEDDPSAHSSSPLEDDPSARDNSPLEDNLSVRSNSPLEDNRPTRSSSPLRRSSRSALDSGFTRARSDRYNNAYMDYICKTLYLVYSIKNLKDKIGADINNLSLEQVSCYMDMNNPQAFLELVKYCAPMIKHEENDYYTIYGVAFAGLGTKIDPHGEYWEAFQILLNFKQKLQEKNDINTLISLVSSLNALENTIGKDINNLSLEQVSRHMNNPQVFLEAVRRLTPLIRYGEDYQFYIQGRLFAGLGTQIDPRGKYWKAFQMLLKFKLEIQEDDEESEASDIDLPDDDAEY